MCSVAAKNLRERSIKAIARLAELDGDSELIRAF